MGRERENSSSFLHTIYLPLFTSKEKKKRKKRKKKKPACASVCVCACACAYVWSACGSVYTGGKISMYPKALPTTFFSTPEGSLLTLPISPTLPFSASASEGNTHMHLPSLSHPLYQSRSPARARDLLSSTRNKEKTDSDLLSNLQKHSRSHSFSSSSSATIDRPSSAQQQQQQPQQHKASIGQGFTRPRSRSTISASGGGGRPSSSGSGKGSRGFGGDIRGGERGKEG